MHQPPNPPTDPPPKYTSPNPPIATQINAATAPLHHTLNASIVRLLPLALPPHASSPSLYTLGLLPFAAIFTAFESAFEDARPAPSIYDHSPIDRASGTCAVVEYPRQKHRRKICRGLQRLRPQGLARTARFEEDVAFLQRRAEEEYERREECGGARAGLKRGCRSVHRRAAEACRYWCENRRSRLPEGEVGADVVERMRKVAEERPHVLVAYAWVWYMAVFSGGRYIREQLGGANREEFWEGKGKDKEELIVELLAGKEGSGMVSRMEKGLLAEDLSSFRRGEWSSLGEKQLGLVVAEQASEDQLGYSYLSYCGDQDGDGIKEEFKRRLEEFEVLLTEQDREDIVVEAKEIFNSTIQLVKGLEEQLKPCVASSSSAFLFRSGLRKFRKKRLLVELVIRVFNLIVSLARGPLFQRKMAKSAWSGSLDPTDTIDMKSRD